MAAAREGSTVSLTEALENYAANHPETIDDLLLWPATKFEHFYQKFQRRQVIEGMERQKNSMVAALWSNSNWDDDKGSRRQMIESLESQYSEAVTALKTMGTTNPEDEIDHDNPFFAAAERGVAKVERRMGYIPDQTKKSDDEIDMMKGLDQAL